MTAMSTTPLRLAPDDLTLDAALAMIREYAPDAMAEAYSDFVKDKSYQRYPLGQEAAAYLRIKAVQKLLGHASIQTTGDVYADWDIEALAHSMEQVFEADDGD